MIRKIIHNVHKIRLNLDSSNGMIVVVCLIVIATCRIISTYSIFSHTYDEPAYIANGLEWLDRGTFDAEVANPPLPKILIATYPYAKGLHFKNAPIYASGIFSLYNCDNYETTLAACRAAVLPFFWIVSLAIWHWSRKLSGSFSAIIAVLLFTNLPPILAHGGLATSDLAITAMFTCFLIAFPIWLDVPSLRNSVILAFSLAFALLSKFSTIPFAMACAGAMLLTRWCATRGQTRRPWCDWMRAIFICIGLMGIIILCMYRFSIGTLAEAKGMREILRSTDSVWIHQLANLPLPASKFFQGLGSLILMAREGKESYLFGEVSYTGWWYFFPVVLSVKTPIGFLILVASGSWFLWTRDRCAHQWRSLVPLVSTCAILLVCLPSKFNLGVRYILPIYPILSVIAAHATSVFWVKGRGYRLLCVTLVSWTVISSVASHPDYLPYFNELSGPHPEYILAESDLDWGQDVNRLRIKLSELNVQHFSFDYFGVIDCAGHKLPSCKMLKPGQTANGWVAISLHNLMFYPKRYAWLRDRKPDYRIGHSIHLYYIPRN